MNYLEFTKLELQNLKLLLKSYQEQRANLPSCNMTCRDISGKKHYYISCGNSKYAYTDDQQLIEDIKRKHFLDKSIAFLTADIRGLERLMRTFRPCDYVSVNDSLPRVYRLTGEESADAEMTSIAGMDSGTETAGGVGLNNVTKGAEVASSTRSTKTATDAKAAGEVGSESTLTMHRTSFGLQVRSKSEALIAEMLHANKITFEYELPLLLKDDGSQVLVRPDFTIITKCGSIYWEHMGMMSKTEYADKALKKIALYTKNGITIPNNLIITMDSQDGIIDMMRLKVMIHGLPV